MAYRAFADAGITAAAGSDFSPGPFAPLMGIQGMVTRTGWNGETWGAAKRISVEEALRVNTINGAYASREEAIKGSITAGKLADFVVLADDPHMVALDRIKDIEIVRTVTGGNTVYQANLPSSCPAKMRAANPSGCQSILSFRKRITSAY